MTVAPDHDPLARFVDRWTVRFDRTVTAPIAEEWSAVTEGDRLDVWLMPTCHVEPRLGGAANFTFGDPAGVPLSGTVQAWVPPHTTEYAFANGNRLRFELTPVPGGTHVVVVYAYAEGTAAVPIDDDPGGDAPGGPDSPWQPGFLAGLHLCVDGLQSHLAGRGHQTATETQAAVDIHHAGDHDPRWLDLVVRYRALITRAQPPATGSSG